MPIASRQVEFPAFQEKQAAALTANLLGGQGWRCRPFGAGKFSQTFETENRDGQGYVLRIAPPDGLRQLFYEYRMMRQEPVLHQRLQAEIRVPVPPIIARHDNPARARSYAGDCLRAVENFRKTGQPTF